MINRATFYRHYGSKYDLVQQCLQDLIDEVPTRRSSDRGSCLPRRATARSRALLPPHFSECPLLPCHAPRGRMSSFAEQMRASIERASPENSRSLSE
jgi:AcrR family transcriptional regulator